jgi:hypothetical protein
VSSSYGQQHITRSERADIARGLQEAIEGKLPSSVGIKHEGYVIFSEAMLLRLKTSNEQQWNSLAIRAKALPNVADSVLVMSVIAESVPAGLNQIRNNLLEEARSLAERILTPLDRMSRLESLAKTASEFNMDLARRCLKSGFSIAKGTELESDVDRRGLIDLAYRIDPELAKSLITELDDDPATKRHRMARQRLNVRQVLRNVPKKGLEGSGALDLDNESLCELCWMMLGGLHSGSVSYLPVDQVSGCINRASEMQLREAYPILAWAIENSVHLHRLTPYGSTYLVELFEACALTCELGALVISQSVGYSSLSMTLRPSGVLDGDTVTIQPGEREKAVGAIREWLRRVQPSYLKISDPYFSPADLELVKIVMEINPTCSMQILAGEKKHRDLRITGPYDAAYQQQWQTISQHAAPEVDIVVAGFVKNSECPVHERWLLFNGSGLRLGSSFSGLGGSRLTDISEMKSTVARDHEEQLDLYLSCRMRDNNNERIRYSRFCLY